MSSNLPDQKPLNFGRSSIRLKISGGADIQRRRLRHAAGEAQARPRPYVHAWLRLEQRPPQYPLDKSHRARENPPPLVVFHLFLICFKGEPRSAYECSRFGSL